MRNKRLFRFVALFLAFQTLYAAFIPTISYALTSGPTAPEATSFEPVDTTDMVNLLTGDFTYNLPLLEVPGPAGGYPLSLSYHAGIQPNMDASWVGLGWTLNPGAISRTVNGYPDDHQFVMNTDRSFWEGGETETYTVGLSVGIANTASVSSGLSFANDTYRGRGVGAYMGIGIGQDFGPMRGSMSATVGSSPYGDPFSSAGIGVGIRSAENNGMRLSGNVGLSVNSVSGIQGNVSGGVDWVGPQNNSGRSNSGSLLDANLSTGGGKSLLSVGGGSVGVHNSQANNVSVESSSLDMDVPVYPGVNVRLGYSYQRYWIDESVNVQTNGTLYYPKKALGADVVDNIAFDTYDLLDIGIDMASNSTAEKVLGGSFPNYDQYTVTGQGIGGNIRPYHYQRDLYRQNKKGLVEDKEVYLVKNYPLEAVDREVGFRFVHDFSNKFEYNPGDFSSSASEPLSFAFDTTYSTGEFGKEGYVNNQLAGSKHIEWFTNSQIIGEDDSKNPTTYGFIDSNASGFAREGNSQVGGYMIKNESGVTYHYSLPAYSYDEYMKSENTESFKEEKGDSYNILQKPEKYAYTWYLTALTGPDYVDVNNNNLVDDEDWGYWVSFDYGKWTDSYTWRNPSEGAHRDIDGEFQNFASGKKEVYYLDAIRTATHTALFVKKLRKDGKGVSSAKEGGFIPSVPYEEERNTRGIYSFPVSVLGLKEVYLLKNSDVTNLEIQKLKTIGEKYSFDFDFIRNTYDCYDDCGQGDYCCEEGEFTEKVSINHYGNNVLDESDFKSAELRTKSLRVIQLQTSYSLSGKTSNSMDNEMLYSASPKVELAGKLTLNSVHFLGKGGKAFLPPTSFTYSNNNPDYNEEAYDMWGYYKSDFDSLIKENVNENVARLTTEASAQAVDAWSLTSITTPLGASINIEYESDWYDDVELTKQQALRIKEVEDLKNGSRLKISFWEESVDLSNFFEVNDTTEIDILGSYHPAKHERHSCSCENGTYGRDYQYQKDLLTYRPIPFSSENAVIKEVNIEEGTIVIEDSALYNQLKQEEVVVQFSPEYLCDEYYTCTYVIEDKWPDFIPGGVCSTTNKRKPGGGLRVKSIAIKSQEEEAITMYEYGGGTTSYEPFVLLPFISHPDYPAKPVGTKIKFKRSVLKRYADVIGIAREVPGPGVMYKNVTVKEKRKYGEETEHILPNYSTYEFNVYKKGMVGIYREGINQQEQEGRSAGIPYKKIVSSKLALKDYSARVGELKSITLYDNLGTPLTKTLNHYLHDGLGDTFEANISSYEDLLEERFKNQGVVHETFSNARFVRYSEGEVVPYSETGGIARASGQDLAANSSDFDQEYFDSDQYHLLGIINKRETYPSVLTGQTNVNYKTGITTTSQNLAYDFYSGEVTKTLTQDSYGNFYVSEKVPAYKKYNALGLAINGGKNMLTQTAATVSYKVSDSIKLTPAGLLSASVQTWSDQVAVANEEVQEGIWRKHAAYQWDGQEGLNDDGTYPYPFADFEDKPFFNFESVAANENWQQTGEITLYDVHSHALEAKDINGNLAASHTDPTHAQILASTANAGFYEIGFSGAEYPMNELKDGDVSLGEGSASSARSHTGRFSLQVAFNTEGFNHTLRSSQANLNKKYKASVWVYLPGASETAEQIGGAQLFYRVDGKEYIAHPVVQKNKSKSWYLLELNIDPRGAEDVYIGCRNQSSRTIYFDDFRFHPIDAAFTSYVYDYNSGELTHILDGNNIYTLFEYNAMGKLVRTSREMMNFDYGAGNESFRSDRILNEVIYNYGANQE
jgi:hypothetical protein